MGRPVNKRILNNAVDGVGLQLIGVGWIVGQVAEHPVYVVEQKGNRKFLCAKVGSPGITGYLYLVDSDTPVAGQFYMEVQPPDDAPVERIRTVLAHKVRTFDNTYAWADVDNPEEE